jgi:hypothetical protein
MVLFLKNTVLGKTTSGKIKTFWEIGVGRIVVAVKTCENLSSVFYTFRTVHYGKL